MTRSSAGRAALGAVVLLAVAALVGCGSDGQVVAGQAGPSTAPAPPTTITAPPVDDPGPSPVAGLDAAALRAAVVAPVPPAARRTAGPTADRVTLPDGRTVWRVRLPGDAPVRAARATVAVGGVEVGEATPTPTLDALVAVTTDGAPLVRGARVTLRWEAGEPADVGALEVVA